MRIIMNVPISLFWVDSAGSGHLFALRQIRQAHHKQAQYTYCPSAVSAGSPQVDSGHFFALRQAQDTKFRRRRNLVEAAGVEP